MATPPPPQFRARLSVLLFVAALIIALLFPFPLSFMNAIARPLSHRIFRPTSTSVLTSCISTSTSTSHTPPFQQIVRKMSTEQQSIPPEPKALTKLPFIDAVKLRRSVYALDKTSPIPDSVIVQLVKDTILHVPSSFNSQTTRMVLLVKDEHKKFWDMTYDVHKEAMSGDAEKWKRSEPRFAGFLNAYGTVLFFESNAQVKKMQEASPAYAPLFPPWSEHTSAMHQFVLWTALEAEGFGANLQHYQFIPKVTAEAIKVFDLPSDWDLKAQLVFGGLPEGMPKDKKPKMPTEESLRIFGVDSD